jgi:WD40 repeat protein
VNGLSGGGVRVLIAGTATHVAGSALPDVPTVAETVAELGRTLVSECGVPAAQVEVVIDPADPTALAASIDHAAREADEVFVFYYIGHGLISAGGHLYVATRATDHHVDGLSFKALPYATLRDTVAACAAQTVILVLDTCYSGRADWPTAMLGDRHQLTKVQGCYLLTSAAGHEQALAPPDEEQTAFTGELIRLLRAGDPAGPPEITLDHAYRYLSRALPAAGRPRPRCLAADHTGDLVLAANRAYLPPAIRPPRVDGPDRAVDAACPYPGLAAFDVDDARFFFGRDALVEELLEALAERSRGGPVVVVGPSGSGKSSLLRAGLLPALREHPVSGGSSRWRHLLITPGEEPMRTLAEQLRAGGGEPAPDAELANDPIRFGQAMARLARRQAGRGDGAAEGDADAAVVVIVDQFEELFTLCRDEAQRDGFVEALCAAGETIDGGPSPVRVVISVRADFYTHCSGYRRLLAALRDCQVLVGPMTADELREAIEGPARLAGLALEPGLTEILLREVGAHRPSGHDPGILPLLSHALLTTWQQREDRVLTVAGYRATGGVEKAIATTADRVYTGLDATGRQIAQRMLLRMVQVGDGADDTRRRAHLAALTDARDPNAGEQVLHRLVDARLVTVDRDSAEITHEALLRAWPLLREWVDADRDRLRTQQRVGADATAWHASGRDPSLLYRGGQLAAALERLDAQQASDMEAPAGEFVWASVAQQRRAARFRRAVMAALVVLAVLALSAAGLAVSQQRAARSERRVALAQRDVALSRQLASQARALRESDPNLAKQLAVLAYRVAPTTEAIDSLVSDTAATGTIVARAGGLAYSPDSRKLLVSFFDGGPTVGVWDIQRHTWAAMLTGGQGETWSAALSRDGRLVAAGGASRDVLLWDLTDPSKTAPVRTLTGHAGEVVSVAFSPNSRILATGGTDGTVRLWDPASHQPALAVLVVPSERRRPIASLSFSLDGGVLAAADDAGTRLWQVSTPQRPALLAKVAKKAGGGQVAFSGSGILATGDAYRLMLWDLANAKRPKRITTLPFQGPIVAMALSPDGRTLAVSDDGGHVKLWDLAIPRSPIPLPGLTGPPGGAVNSIAFAPDGRTVATASIEDQTVRLWDLAGSHRPIMLGDLDPRTDHVSLAEIGAGRTFAIVQHRDKATVWDMQDPQRPVIRARMPIVQDPNAPIVFTPDGRTMARVNPLRVLGLPDGEVPTQNEIASRAQLALRPADEVLELWDISDPRKPVRRARVTRPPGELQSLAFRRDGRVLATAGGSGTIAIWDVSDPRTPRVLTTINRPAGGVYPLLAMSPTADILLASNNGQTGQLWDLSDPRRPTKIAELNGLGQDVGFCEFSPDGRILLCLAHGAGRLWDVSDPRRPRALPALAVDEAWGRRSAAFSPDARLLAIADGKGVRLWDLADPQRSTIRASIPEIWDSVAFSSNGQALIGSTLNDEIKTWQIDPEAVIARTCATIGEYLTPEEWRRYAELPFRPPCN